MAISQWHSGSNSNNRLDIESEAGVFGRMASFGLLSMTFRLAISNCVFLSDLEYFKQWQFPVVSEKAMVFVKAEDKVDERNKD